MGVEKEGREGAGAVRDMQAHVHFVELCTAQLRGEVLLVLQVKMTHDNWFLESYCTKAS